MKKVGILGGTFDPPHIGHLIIAEEVAYQENLDEVWFIPTNIPPHKLAANSEATNRVAMLQLAIEGNKCFQVNTIEVERNNVSYSIDTVKSLQDHYPNINFHFIIGADMVEYLPNWYQIDDLMKIIPFIGVHRPGYSLETTYPMIKVEVPLIPVSSSLIRDRIKKAAPFHYFLTEKVANYIKEHQLYGYK